jgi:GNAT superfamily N-acetyltransferase
VTASQSPAGIWFARRPIGGASSTLFEYAGVAGDEHPDGAVVDIDEDIDDAEPMVVARAEAAGPETAGRVLDVRVAPWVVPRAPRAWYVELPDPDARPPTMTLVAFATDHFAVGTVIDQATFTDLPVRSSEQIGAFRWWTSTGQGHEIYVNPSFRRRQVGTSLTFAVEGYRAASGWSPLWGGGERTDLGEAWTRALPAVFRGRVARRTKVMPPMTPPGR